MTRIHTDLSRVPISVAPSPATSGTSLGVTDANAAFLPDTYPYWAVCVPTGAAPTRSNSEIVKVTGGSSSGGTTTLTITRAQGIPVTTAQTITTSFDIYDANSSEANIGLNSLIINETPSGTVNGSNTAFDTASTYVAGSIQVYRDGQLMKGGGEDYTETDSNTITFTTAPTTGSVLLVTYQHTVSTTGNADTLDGYHANATPTAGQIPVLDSAMAMIGGGMSRQALINGNFDVWQRGTSVALTAADGYTADRWYAETATATTDKTISQQDGTGVEGSRYCLRYLAAQDVDALNTLSNALETQDSIKFRGKKLTLSFYARGGAEFVADNATLVSKIVTGKGTDQKVLAFTTSADGVSQNNTLTTSWVKFTCTTSAVIASDITQIGVSFAFTHAGAGVTTNYFEVAQVQLCAGDVALPFQPKSYHEEENNCRRFCWQIDGATDLGVTQSNTTSAALCPIIHPVTMRTAPTLETSTISGSNFSIVANNNIQNITGLSIGSGSSKTTSLSIACSGAGLIAREAGALRIATSHYIRLVAEL